MSLRLLLNKQEVPVRNQEEVLGHLQHAIGPASSQVELRHGGMKIRFAGTRSQMYLEVERERTVAFCLSKRKQTLRELKTQKGSLSVPVYQILQKEDVMLIVSCLLEGKTLPDAYHQESVSGRLG